MPQILKYKAFDDWTGGVQGLVIDKPDAPFGLTLSPDQWLYLFTLGGRGGAVRRRLEHRARPRRAGDDGDPRPCHGGRGDGHQPSRW